MFYDNEIHLPCSTGWGSGIAETEERRGHLAREQTSRLRDQDRFDGRQSAVDDVDVERQVCRQEKVDINSGQKVKFSYIFGIVEQQDQHPEPGKNLII